MKIGNWKLQIGLMIAALACLATPMAQGGSVVPLPGNPFYNYKVTLNYADLTAAAGAADTTATIAILPYPSGNNAAGLAVTASAMSLTTAFDFSDTGINSLTLQVGDGGDTDRLLPATQVAVDGTEITYWATSHATTTLPYAYTAADTIDALFTVLGGASPLIDEATSGEVVIYLQVVDLNKFSGN